MGGRRRAPGVRPGGGRPTDGARPGGHPFPAGSGGIRVRPADDDATHALAFEVISAVWGDPAVCQFFAPRTRTRLYLAETESGPVGAATTLRHSDGVRIFSVSTLPEHRDRGVASALLGGIAAGERAAGVPTATLRTVDGLIPFYERLGYRVVGHMRRFRRPGGPGRRAPT